MLQSRNIVDESVKPSIIVSADSNHSVTTDASKAAERLINIADYWIQHTANCNDPHCSLELKKAITEAKRVC